MVEASRQNWEEADHAFEQAVKLASFMPYPYAEAKALYEWGTADGAREKRETALTRLKQAQDIFLRLGARYDIKRTEQALEAITNTKA